jgi:hypothetical protein
MSSKRRVLAAHGRARGAKNPLVPSIYDNKMKIVAYIIQVPSSTKMFLIHFLTHQMQFLKQAFCQEIWVTFEKFVSTIFFILSNFTYIHFFKSIFL